METGWEPKSRGTEETFDRDVLDLDFLRDKLQEQVESMAELLRERQWLARTITLKVRYQDFQTITRSRTLPHPTDRARTLARVASELLLGGTEAGRRPIRLLGLSVSGLLTPEDPVQLWLDLEE